MFHSINGLFFGRLPDGSVRIVKNDGMADMEKGKILDMSIPADIWASIISTVSAGGESDLRWYLAKDFHESKGECRIVPADPVAVDLRKALVGIVGSDDKEELERMEAVLRAANVPEEDKMNTINAIHAILRTKVPK